MGAGTAVAGLRALLSVRMHGCVLRQHSRNGLFGDADAGFADRSLRVKNRVDYDRIPGGTHAVQSVYFLSDILAADFRRASFVFCCGVWPAEEADSGGELMILRVERPVFFLVETLVSTGNTG